MVQLTLVREHARITCRENTIVVAPICLVLDRVNMFSILEDRFVDDIASRADQFRSSYYLQTEEFRHLNENLLTYVNDMKRMDNENRQLERTIDEIRKAYVATLASQLERLPADFREESNTLTTANLERYRSKSRARRCLNEREELKKRIHFLSVNEKEYNKRLNSLQRQDRTMRTEITRLAEHYRQLTDYVQAEKQTHRRAMSKVDELQNAFEQICIDRSKTEVTIVRLLVRSPACVCFQFCLV